jgi:hypothetical protein
VPWVDLHFGGIECFGGSEVPQKYPKKFWMSMVFVGLGWTIKIKKALKIKGFLLLIGLC